jgi:hypothetical protein
MTGSSARPGGLGVNKSDVDCAEVEWAGPCESRLRCGGGLCLTVGTKGSPRRGCGCWCGPAGEIGRAGTWSLGVPGPGGGGGAALRGKTTCFLSFLPSPCPLPRIGTTDLSFANLLLGLRCILAFPPSCHSPFPFSASGAPSVSSHSNCASSSPHSFPSSPWMLTRSADDTLCRSGCNAGTSRGISGSGADSRRGRLGG